MTYRYAVAVTTEPFDPFVFLGVPDAHPTVFATTSEILAIRTYRESPDLIGVATQIPSFSRLPFPLVYSVFVERVYLATGMQVPLDDGTFFARCV